MCGVFLVGLVMLFIVLVIVDSVSIGVREGFFSFLFFFWFCGFVGTFFDMFLLVLVIWFVWDWLVDMLMGKLLGNIFGFLDILIFWYFSGEWIWFVGVIWGILYILLLGFREVCGWMFVGCWV